MIIKFVVNILVLISSFRSTGADYGMDDITRYRLNADVKSFPVKSPDELFGFEVPPNVEQNMRVNTKENNKQNKNQNNNNNNNNIENHDYEEYLDQNNVLREPYPPKKAQKNRLKTYRKPMAAKPMKMIYSQYLSPQELESEDSFQLNPAEDFGDQYLAQLMKHIMSTAEQMAFKHEEEVRQFEQPVIPASQLLEYLRSSQFYTLSDDSDPYGIKRSDKTLN